MAAILSVRTAIASAGVVSTAVILRLTGPSMVDFLSAAVPRIYSSLLSWLTPPYLYFVINGIIISIAASSRFHMTAARAETRPTPQASQHEFVQPEKFTEVKAVEVEEPRMVEASPEYGKTELMVYGEEVEKKAEEDENDFVISRSSWSPKRRVSREIPTEYSAAGEKPLVSARFSHHRKTVKVKASPEAGKALGVARSKRNETLESTWKTITDGRPVPLARHLKKSDTWDVHCPTARENNTLAVVAAAPPPMRKAETFNDRRQQASAGKLRREPSVGQDDLNRRVEAFIKKFNDEMRLQRQESFQHYMDMINRGSH